MFCCALICVPSSLQLSDGKERGGCFALVVLLVSADCCVAHPHDPRVCLQFVIVVFPSHTRLLFL